MDYIEKVLCLQVRYQVWEKISEMPYFIVDRYNLQRVIIGDVKTVFIEPIYELDQINTIKKHIARIQKVDNVPVVLLLNAITRQRREYLIGAKIPFVVPDKQLYLPFMGAVLQEKYDVGIVPVEKLPPSAQLLLFYYLYQKKERVYTVNAVEALGFSAMTITRATRQLLSTGLFELEKEGVQKILIGKYSGKELFDKATPFLINPIRKSIFVGKTINIANTCISGLSALSEYTMINPGPVACYAVNNGRHGIDGTSTLIDSDVQAELQLWKYDPEILGKDGVVDPLSLAMIFNDVIDERIEEAIEELLKHVWEE